MNLQGVGLVHAVLLEGNHNLVMQVTNSGHSADVDFKWDTLSALLVIREEVGLWQYHDLDAPRKQFNYGFVLELLNWLLVRVDGRVSLQTIVLAVHLVKVKERH